MAGTVAKRQRTAQEAWNNKLLNEANPMPEIGKIQRAGQQGVQDLQASFKVAYQHAWDSINPANVNLGDLSGTWQRLGKQISKDIPTDTQGEAGRILANARDLVVQFGQTGKTEYLERADDILREAGWNANGSAQTWFGRLRKGLREAMPNDASKRLLNIDDKYADYKILERASTYKKALENGGVFTPSDLTGAVKAKGSDYRLAGGSARMQQKAKNAVDTIDGFLWAVTLTTRPDNVFKITRGYNYVAAKF